MEGLGGTLSILLKVALLLLAARLGGEAARRLHQPVVAGEILAGLVLGPTVLGWIVLDSTGLPASLLELAHFQESAVLEALATLGVLLLLFQVGLESSLKEFAKVRASAGLVGVYGVAFSVLVGFLASWAFAQTVNWTATDAAIAQPFLLHLFVGATLAATSIGITARVFRELGVLATPEAQIVLGAAVFDDILGLVILATVSGLLLDPAGFSALALLRILLIAAGFVALAILVGPRVAPRGFVALERWFGGHHALLGFAMVFMIGLSALAEQAGLAAILGAFAAGLALSGSKPGQQILADSHSLGRLLVGLFFVLLGVRIDLSTLDASTGGLALALAAILAVLAVGAKLLSGLGVVGTGASRLVVGVGMIPRGEVGLIFAVFGLQNGLIAEWQYAALVLVVLATTLMTPPWLNALTRRFTRVDSASSGQQSPDSSEG